MLRDMPGSYDVQNFFTTTAAEAPMSAVAGDGAR
jgi:hypothetical protein